MRAANTPARTRSHSPSHVPAKRRRVASPCPIFPVHDRSIATRKPPARRKATAERIEGKKQKPRQKEGPGKGNGEHIVYGAVVDIRQDGQVKDAQAGNDISRISGGYHRAEKKTAARRPARSRVPYGDGFSAVAAPAPASEPRQHRDKVIPRKHVPAGIAFRP